MFKTLSLSKAINWLANNKFDGKSQADDFYRDVIKRFGADVVFYNEDSSELSVLRSNFESRVNELRICA